MDEAALARELMATYRAEARERLEAVTRLLVELERERSGPAVAAGVEQIYREVHSLKGAARSVSQPRVEEAAHAFEDLLAAARGRESLEDLAIQEWYTHLDRLNALLNGGERGPTVASPEDAPREAVAPTPPPDPDESIRIATSRLDRLMADVGTLLVSEQAQSETIRQLIGFSADFRTAERALHRRAAEPRQVQEQLHRFAQRLELAVKEMQRQRIEVRRQLQILDDDIRALRMTPVRTIFRSFDRMVRDLARESGKLIDLEMSGEETELDKSVLDSLRDPLLHLIRNAIDHGIETPLEREAAGKPSTGHLRLTARREGSQVMITLEDDGRGIDSGAVRAQAVRMQLVSPAEAGGMTQGQLFELLFRSGFSTRSEVSEISGRGLGLAIVRQALERLRGTVVIEGSAAGQGTVFTLTLPLTLATTRCLLLAAGGNTFAIPLAAIHRTVAVSPQAITHVQGRPTLRFDDRPARFVHLTALLQGRAVEAPDRLPVVILDSPAGRVAIGGEELRGEQELVVKQLPGGLPPVPYLAGAATLASGEVILVVDPRALVRLALETLAGPGLSPPRTTPAAAVRRRVLVVDDSLTTRTLERNILQAVGYEVTVAADGADAWTMLEAQPFDLVVTDIEMPNLDGIGLTQRIRAHARLRSVPVVLVTARAEPEDRVRGLQAGADAYIVKRDFRQSDLLETIDRLLGRPARPALEQSA